MFAQISTAKNHYPHLFNFENYPKYSRGYTGIINKIHDSPKLSCKVGYIHVATTQAVKYTQIRIRLVQCIYEIVSDKTQNIPEIHRQFYYTQNNAIPELYSVFHQ